MHSKCAAFFVVMETSLIIVVQLLHELRALLKHYQLVIAIPLAPLSHFHVGVKSVPHWLQLNGTG